MERHVRQLACLHEAAPIAAQVVRRQWIAFHIAEHERAGVGLALPQRDARFQLLTPVLAQRLDGGGRQRDRAPAGLGFRRLELQPGARLFEAAFDPQCRLVEIDVPHAKRQQSRRGGRLCLAPVRQ